MFWTIFSILILYVGVSRMQRERDEANLRADLMQQFLIGYEEGMVEEAERMRAEANKENEG
jgi:hypothetical protein